MPINLENLKKFKSLDLSEYDEKLAGQSIEVWINPSRAVWLDFGDENIPLKDRTLKIYSQIWGISLENVTTIFEKAEVQLWQWMTKQSMAMVSEYAEIRKKAEKA